MEREIATNRVNRIRGGIEQDIDEAWENLGYLIVNDACEEWLECAKRIRKLTVKEKWRGYLTQGEKIVITRSQAEKKITEDWLNSDFCYSLCGHEGKELIDNLKKRVN